MVSRPDQNALAISIKDPRLPPTQDDPQAADPLAEPHAIIGPTPGWLILRAFLWLLAAEAAAYAAAFLVAFFAGLLQALTHTQGWRPSTLAYALGGTVALQSVLLLADFHQGRLLGNRSLAAGLGAGPVRRPRLIVLFAVLMVAWVGVFIALLLHFLALANFIAKGVPPTPLLELLGGGPLAIAVRLLLIAVVAPIAEELFFRGWLWTALRRSWSVWPTALFTGGIWLALHALEGPVRVPILLPAAILLSLARHYGGSVRASLPIHVINNLTAVAIQLAALLLLPR